MRANNTRQKTRSGADSLVLAIALALAIPAGGASAWAQGQSSGQPAGAPAPEAQPKQVALTQKIVDNLIAAQKQIRAVEAKAPQNENSAPDPKVEAKIDGIVKSSGFASMSDFADASYSVGMVLAGMDPDAGTYIGTQAALKKQVDEVNADKKMPPKEKKEALDELDAAMKSSDTEKPMAGNIDVVKANLAKLNEGMQQGD